MNVTPASGGARTCNGVSIDTGAVAVSLDNFGRDRVSRCIHIVAVGWIAICLRISHAKIN